MRLAAIPATVTDLVERLFVRCMVILLIKRNPPMRIEAKRLRSDQGGFRAGTGAVVKDRNVLGRNHRRPDANITDFLEATIQLC
jgi:hypothetical protein